MPKSDIFNYEHPFVTTDAVVLSVHSREQDGHRKLPEVTLRVLMYKRTEEPYKGLWSLPGGFLNIDELPEDNIRRKLSAKTSISNCYLEQLYTFCDIDRDPRSRVLSITYLGLMPEDSLTELPENAEWLTISPNQKEPQLLTPSLIAPAHRDGNGISANCAVAFDHLNIIDMAIKRLQNKIEYCDIALKLMPEEFTLTHFQNVYNAILADKHQYQKANFRRKTEQWVEPTGNMSERAGHRTARLFRRRKNNG